ncbi:hypothetical protein AAIH45_33475, partial [Pseudomonas aeruginosa]
MSSQSSNTESLSRFPLWQVITPVRRKVILAMALAGLAALTSLGALLFLAWSLRDIRATPDAIPAWPLGGVIGCVVFSHARRRGQGRQGLSRFPGVSSAHSGAPFFFLRF